MLLGIIDLILINFLPLIAFLLSFRTGIEELLAHYLLVPELLV